jgi:transposase-like protein
MEKIKKQPVYTKEFKEEMVRRMLPPESKSPKELAKESGVSKTSLVNWLKKVKAEESIESRNEQIKWIPVNTPDKNKDKTSNPVKVKIGKATIEVEPGFNENFLLELMRVVAKV